MADITDEVIQLRQIVATLQTALSAQQSDTTQLRSQLEASRHEIEQLITSQIETHITEFLPDIIAKIHPNFGAFLAVFDGKTGGDLKGLAESLAPLLSGEEADISPQQLEQIGQHVRLLIQDTIHQHISQMLTSTFL